MSRQFVFAALLTLVASSFAAAEASAVDRYAVVHFTNKTEVTIHFEYRFADGLWNAASVAPGDGYCLYAGFTAPGSYAHDKIEVRFDQDMSDAVWYRHITPYVKYLPDVDAARAQRYDINYDGDTRAFIEMFYHR